MPDGCIEYQGHRNPQGYGRFGLTPSKTILAHRLAWILKNGPVPTGLSVLHHCDNPPCCNSDHLFVGTLADNNADMRMKRRDAPPPHPRGADHPRAKLTAIQVEEIRSRHIPRRVTARCLAEEYGVTVHTVRAILQRRNWR